MPVPGVQSVDDRGVALNGLRDFLQALMLAKPLFLQLLQKS